MRVEILYLPGCPGYRRLVRELPALLDRCGMDAHLSLSRMQPDRAGNDSRFLGSPTVRVDGRDVEPGGAERSVCGLRCRLYQTADGISNRPPDEWIISAARKSADVSG